MDLMFYENVFRTLSIHRVRYVVVGGVALVLHGVVRFTVDLDLAVSLDRENLGSFLSAMHTLGFTPRAPVDVRELMNPAIRERWKQEKGMKVFTFVHPTSQLQQIDVFIDEPVPFEDLWRDAQVFDLFGVQVYVVSRSDLKRLKFKAGRAQDLADVASLDDLERLDERG